jgi:hypothetical protein
MKFFISVFFLIFSLTYFSVARAQDSIDDESSASIPVFYPEETIASVTPFFIWYDLYNERDIKDNVKYKITIKSEKGHDIEPVLVSPGLFEKYYYYFKWPFTLETGKYKYSIERLSNLQQSKLKYFHYLKYPVTGEFEIDSQERTIKDNLPPERLIEYIRLEKENRLVSRNNFFFFSGASAGAFGIGLLFYKVLHFGIISKIIYYIAFTSSAVGAGAAGYYGVNYLIERSNLTKITDISKNVSLNGEATANRTRIDFELRY